MEIAATLNYLRVPARTQMFDYGDHGDLLYIVLDGLVDVIVPLEKEKQEEIPAVLDKEKLLAYKRDSTVHLERRSPTLYQKKDRKNLWKSIKQKGVNFVEEYNDSKEMTAEPSVASEE